MVDVVS